MILKWNNEQKRVLNTGKKSTKHSKGVRPHPTLPGTLPLQAHHCIAKVYHNFLIADKHWCQTFAVGMLNRSWILKLIKQIFGLHTHMIGNQT